MVFFLLALAVDSFDGPIPAKHASIMTGRIASSRLHVSLRGPSSHT